MGNIFEKILKKRQEERAPDAENAGAREPGSLSEYRLMRFAGRVMVKDERFVPKNARIIAYDPPKYAEDLAGAYIALRKKDPEGWGGAGRRYGREAVDRRDAGPFTDGLQGIAGRRSRESRTVPGRE